MQRWLKTWSWLISLIIALSALAIASLSLYNSNAQSEEVTKLRILHSEISDRLVMLDSGIARTLTNIEDAGITDQFQNEVMEAIKLRDQAEVAWNAGNYVEADSLINEAYDVLSQVSLPTPFRWWLLSVVVVAVMLISMGLIVIQRRSAL